MAVLPRVPAALARNATQVWGERGRRWLEDLPRLAAGAAERFGLRIGAPFELSFHWVGEAELADGTRVVLKLGVTGAAHLQNEMDALQAFDGRGAVRLLGFAPALGAMVLERATPDRPCHRSRVKRLRSSGTWRSGQTMLHARRGPRYGRARAGLGPTRTGPTRRARSWKPPGCSAHDCGPVRPELAPSRKFTDAHHAGKRDLEFVAHFLGRRLQYTDLVVDLAPHERLVMRTEQGPFRWRPRTCGTVEGPDSTRMVLRNRGEPTGFVGVAAPLLATAVRRAGAKDLRRLRDILEVSPGATGLVAG